MLNKFPTHTNLKTSELWGIYKEIVPYIGKEDIPYKKFNQEIKDLIIEFRLRFMEEKAYNEIYRLLEE